MRLTNREIEQRLVGLENALELSGYAGYAIATNYRRLSDAAKPYLDMRNQFFMSHDFGEPDENGLIKVSTDSPEFNEFMSTAGKVMDDVIDVDVITISKDELPETLTARQILSIYWMLEGESNE